MAFTTITPTTLTKVPTSSGTAAVTNTAPQNVTAGSGNGVKFLNDGKVFVVVVNKGAAGSITFITGATVQGLAVNDIGPTTLPASGTNDGVSVMGPFDPALYNDSSGFCSIELTTGAGGADFWAFRLP
jgi:hypothetical protein